MIGKGASFQAIVADLVVIAIKIAGSFEKNARFESPELDWATKTVDKKIEDAELGNYKAPGLLLQHETVCLFLEPIARTAPGADGVVDLYLMPSYDDIANLYFYNNRWHIHYLFKRASNDGKAREEEAKPLTKESLRKVFDEMKAHAE